MKNAILFIPILFLIITGTAQEKLYIHKNDGQSLGALINSTDSIYFGNNNSTVNFRINSSVYSLPVSSVDSISFGANSNTVSIIYNGPSVKVMNPLAFEGVNVTVNGADVVVNSTVTNNEVTYNLKGNSSDGSFKIYSSYRLKLELEGVTLTNNDGPAINIQSKKKISVKIKDGTENSLTDGITYATSTEDQKSTFFSEGQLEFSGTGSLVLKSYSNHALCSDDYINILDGKITVTSSGKDGIHSSVYFKMSGGDVNLATTGDGIECEGGYTDISEGKITIANSAANVNSISCDSTLTISGGSISLTVNGNQSKGLKSDKAVYLKGGTINIVTAGNAVLNSSGSGYGINYCTAVKADSLVYINSANLTITCSGTGGKGISSDKNTVIDGGIVKITTTGNGATFKNASGTADSYNATCISADGNISINGGTLTLSSSGTGGKGINSNGTLSIGTATVSPTLTITTSGTKFIESGSGQSAEYNEPKTINADGAITVKNGEIAISSTDDGIKSKTSITIENGTTTISKSTEGIESKYVTINGGTVKVTSSDDALNTTMSLVNGGTESNDGSHFYMNGGYVVLSVTSGDAIDSNGNMTMTGGTLLAFGPSSGANEDIDINGTLLVNGGLMFGCSTSSNMNKPINGSSSQYGLTITTSSGVTSGSIIRFQDSSGNNLGTFKLSRNGYYFHFSSPNLKSGSTYSVYTGGTCTGTLSDGMYTGGTYSGGTLKKSFTISSKITTVTF